MNSNKNLITAMSETYFNGITVEEVTQFTKTDGTTVSVMDSNLTKVLGMVKATNRISDGADKAICKLCAYMERSKGYKALGYKSLADCFSEWMATRFAKSTTHTYSNIGKTFYDEAGNVRFRNADLLSKGQMIPMLGLINNYPIIGDYQFTDKTIEFLLADKAFPLFTVEEIKAFCKTFRDGYIPSALIDFNEDGEPTFDGCVIDTSLIFVPNDDSNDSNDSKGSKDSNDSKDSKFTDEMTLADYIDILRKASLAIDTMGVDAKLVKSLEKAIDAIAKSVNETSDADAK